ncbi:MAG: hypothetical protein EXX96DRAFT_518466 [Benjaminiella poitrasii]|nr:MAG: hypothetical protein EXX96DRAFT_518466 [Benjaminiella poitrasii]
MRKSTTHVSRLVNSIIDNGKNLIICRRNVLYNHQLATVHQKRSVLIPTSRTISTSAAIVENTHVSTPHRQVCDSLSLLHLSHRATLIDLDLAIQSRGADRAWSLFVTLAGRSRDPIPYNLCCSLYALLEFAKRLVYSSATNKLRQRQMDQLLQYVLQYQPSKELFLASVPKIPVTHHKLIQRAIKTGDPRMAWITFYRFHKDNADHKLPRNTCLKLMLLIMRHKRLDKNQLKMKLQLIALHGSGTSCFDSRYLSAADLTRLAHISYAYQQNDRATIEELVDVFVKGLGKKKMSNRADALDELTWRLICEDDVKRAHQILDQILQQRSVHVNEMIFVNLMNAYRRQRNYHESLKVFEQLLETEQTVTIRAYNTVLQLFAEQKWVSKAQFLFDTLMRLNVEPDIATYTEMIRVNASVGNMKACVHFYNKILQHRHMTTNIYVYSALIKGSSHRNDLKSVFRWFYHMLRDGIEPNEVVMSIVLEALTRQQEPGMPDAVLQIARQSSMLGIKTDTVLYTILLKMQAETIGLKGALKIHRDMVAQSIKPSTYTYTTLIHVCSKHKRPEIGEKIFELMKSSEKHKPNTVTYSVMIDAWSRTNKKDKANSLIIEFLKECKSDKTGRLWLDTTICNRIKCNSICC